MMLEPSTGEQRFAAIGCAFLVIVAAVIALGAALCLLHAFVR